MHGLIPLLSRFVYFNRSDDLLSCHPSSSGVPPEHQRGRGDDAGHLPLREPERGDDVHKLLLLIVSVLRDPMLDDHPTNDEANDVYESDLELFEQMAMAWT